MSNVNGSNYGVPPEPLPRLNMPSQDAEAPVYSQQPQGYPQSNPELYPVQPGQYASYPQGQAPQFPQNPGAPGFVDGSHGAGYRAPYSVQRRTKVMTLSIIGVLLIFPAALLFMWAFIGIVSGQMFK